MNAAVPTQQSVITVKLVKRAGNRATNSSPSPDSDPDFRTAKNWRPPFMLSGLYLRFVRTCR